MYCDIFLRKEILQLSDNIKLKTNILLLKMTQDHFYTPSFLLEEPDYQQEYPTLQNL